MFDDLVRIRVKEVVSEHLLFSRIGNRRIVEACGSAVVPRAQHAAVAGDKHRAHLRVLILRKPRLREHHLRIDFIAELSALGMTIFTAWGIHNAKNLLCKYKK